MLLLLEHRLLWRPWHRGRPGGRPGHWWRLVVLVVLVPDRALLGGLERGAQRRGALAAGRPLVRPQHVGLQVERHPPRLLLRGAAALGAAARAAARAAALAAALLRLLRLLRQGRLAPLLLLPPAALHMVQLLLQLLQLPKHILLPLNAGLHAGVVPRPLLLLLPEQLLLLPPRLLHLLGLLQPRLLLLLPRPLLLLPRPLLLLLLLPQELLLPQPPLLLGNLRLRLLQLRLPLLRLRLRLQRCVHLHILAEPQQHFVLLLYRLGQPMRPPAGDPKPGRARRLGSGHLCEPDEIGRHGVRQPWRRLQHAVGVVGVVARVPKPGAS